MEVPGNGRGYLSRGGAVDLFDEPGGHPAPPSPSRSWRAPAQLFWSTETRAGFVHVTVPRQPRHRRLGRRPASLEPLKKGEMMDQFLPPTTAVAGAQLALDKPPRVFQATR